VPDEAARVGIVLRTKNRPWFLRRSLSDIAAQDFTAWDLHIVNDGGERRDVDAAIAELPAEMRRRVTSTQNSAALGRSAAANQGIAALETEYVVLHDDDDLWNPTFLSRTVEWLDEHPGDGGVVARTEIVYEEGADDSVVFSEVGRAPFWPGMQEITYTDLLQINRAVPISFLYRRSLHVDVGPYREDLHAAEDWDFNLRVALRSHIGFINGPPLAFWMQRVGVEGEIGNSMFALAESHRRSDAKVRDDALREYAARNGPGLALYLTRFISDEVARQLDSRPSDLQRLARTVRGWRPRRREQ